MQVTLEIAELQDAETILRINTDAFNKDSRELGNGGNGGPPGYNRIQHIKDKITNALAYKILLNDTTVGWFYLEQTSPTSVQFCSFAIDPPYQNKGYGMATLRMLDEVLPPGTKKVTLQVPRYGRKYIQMYDKAGFWLVDDTTRDFLLDFEKRIIEK